MSEPQTQPAPRQAVPHTCFISWTQSMTGTFEISAMTTCRHCRWHSKLQATCEDPMDPRWLEPIMAEAEQHEQETRANAGGAPEPAPRSLRDYLVSRSTIALALSTMALCAAALGLSAPVAGAMTTEEGERTCATMYKLTSAIRHKLDAKGEWVALHLKSCTPGPPVRVVYSFLALNRHRKGTVTLTYVDGRWRTTASSTRAAAARAVAASTVQRTLGVAERYWGPSRCTGELHLEYSSTPPTPALAGTEVEAWVQFNTPPQYRTLADPLGWTSPVYTQCVIYLNTTVWPDEPAMQANYPEFCQIMVHEYGHFMGWLDSTTAYPPTDIRYPLQAATNMPKVCLPTRTLHGRHRKVHRSFER